MGDFNTIEYRDLVWSDGLDDWGILCFKTLLHNRENGASVMVTFAMWKLLLDMALGQHPWNPF